MSSNAPSSSAAASRDRVAAVVVTFNRKELLARCLDALAAQTRPVDRVYVVDNASTDGTTALLRARGDLERSTLEHLRLPDNVGGAGGFHAGVDRASAAGFDWLWLMDDDGFVEPRCLEKLIELGDHYDAIGPAIVDADDPRQLNWIFRISRPSGKLTSGGYVTTMTDLAERAVNGVFEGDASFFNGVLISRQVVERVGNVNPAFFIRGDETDYYYRCRIARLRIGTRVDALLYHPPDVLSPDPRKFFYLFRNRVYLHRRYAREIYGGATARLGLLYILFRYLILTTPSRSPRYLATLAKAGWNAYRGRLVPWEPFAA